MIAHKGKFGFRPRLVLGYADSIQAALCARHFRRLGWEVHLTQSGREARRMTLTLEPEVVMLDTELVGESGWLTAAKLLLERPRQKLFMVGAECSPIHERFASFLGAAGFFSRKESAFVLEEELTSTAISV